MSLNKLITMITIRGKVNFFQKNCSHNFELEVVVKQNFFFFFQNSSFRIQISNIAGKI